MNILKTRTFLVLAGFLAGILLAAGAGLKLPSNIAVYLEPRMIVIFLGLSILVGLAYGLVLYYRHTDDMGPMRRGALLFIGFWPFVGAVAMIINAYQGNPGKGMLFMVLSIPATMLASVGIIVPYGDDAENTWPLR